MKINGLMKTTLLDYPGHVACTIFTGGCNLRCPFCHNSDLLDTRIQSEYTIEEIFSFLDKRCHTLDGIAITGGEPTIQPDLPDFVSSLKSRYSLPIKIDTNGTNPYMVQELLSHNLISYIAMDIKTSLPEYNNACGTSVSLSHITATKDLILNSNIPYEFRTTVVKGIHTPGDFEQIGLFIQGAKQYFLQCYKDSGNILDKSSDFQSPTIQELQQYANIVKPYVQQVQIRGIDIDIK